jgi:hypothetical protein
MSRLIESGTTDGVGFGNADETDAPLNVAGEFNVAGTLNLDQALGISGVVLDDSQSPIQNATVGVTLTENGEDVIYDTTDASGAYSFTEHPDGDATKQEWHVTAAKNDAGDLFNAESKPFVRATLPPTIIQATGGDVVQDVTLNGIDYRIHAFTTVGTQTFEVTNAPAQNNTLDVLVVGGGGSGGKENDSGGGGAGGIVQNDNVAVTANTFSITVGDGGVAPSVVNTRGNNGNNSSAFGLIALGGGGGAEEDQAGKDGGSGGGAGRTSNTGGTGLQPTSTSGGFGNNGGPGGSDAGGGGGAAEAGTQFKGGDGLDFSNKFTNQFGENGFFGGGGGGGGDVSDRGSGGIGGGGDGGGHGGGDDGESGTPNTGGGGGGHNNDSATPGDGGSGIVLIRYEI